MGQSDTLKFISLFILTKKKNLHLGAKWTMILVGGASENRSDGQIL